MQVKFAKDIANLLGVPFKLISGGYSEMHGEKKAMQNNKVFITNMMSLCRHLELLLVDVYLASYGGSSDNVKFILRATPRIEIGSVEEICMLLEAGVVSFVHLQHVAGCGFASRCRCQGECRPIFEGIRDAFEQEGSDCCSKQEVRFVQVQVGHRGVSVCLKLGDW